jgi:ADP-heptose:LPS heptosyltransferase
MEEVVDALAEKTDIRLFLFGSPTEKQAIEKLVKDHKNCTNVAGNLKFKEELNLIAQLDVMLSMDSGNGHLAAMFAIPTVTLWGVTHPYAGFTPFGQEKHCILSDREQYPFLPTSVYGDKIPEGYEKVMETIRPKTVVEAIQNLIL